MEPVSRGTRSGRELDGGMKIDFSRREWICIPCGHYWSECVCTKVDKEKYADEVIRSLNTVKEETAVSDTTQT